MTVLFDVCDRASTRRPGEHRDPYRVISLVGAVADTFRN
jgi:hypothetical protein